ncbi:MAG TPA: glycine cleavage system aminomethyltransferase GcvT [Actinomycetota bacterium]|nr:glycine cleavage system aminomethyltransferase GcvT [Actinomycetota bacterium]
MTERATPLLEAHKELGARLTKFGGWEMPLQYEGVIAEHNAVRNDAGLFDVSHLGKLRLKGEVGGAALQKAMTADVLALEPGRAVYSLVLVEDGGCIDDVFVYRVAPSEWLVVPNASNVTAVADAIRACGGDPVDEWDRWAILALQGPKSFDVFESVWPSTGAPGLKLHYWSAIDVFGVEGMVARTGYTGERGFEIYAPAETANEAFRKLLDAGATPVGLGARDTLRLEMGYALYGHELSLDINPLEAGLAWTLAWDKPFVGRDALQALKDDGGPARRTFGVRCKDKGVPREGYAVYSGDQQIAQLTSGNYSPTLGTGIGIGIGARGDIPETGAEVHIDARGRRIAGDIVTTPFIPR